MESNHSNEHETAVLAPSPEYLICVPEIAPPNFQLYSTDTEEFVRVSPSEQGFKAEHRQDPDQSWDQFQTGADIKDVVTQAARRLDLSVSTKICPRTGLEDLYIDTRDHGRLLIDSRDQFPLHIVKKEPNPFEPSNEEFLIEAPDEGAKAALCMDNYHVHTRHCVEDEWEPLHTCYDDISPAAAIDRFSAITDLEALMIDEQEDPSVLFEELHESEIEPQANSTDN